MIPDLAGSGRRIYSLVSVPHRASPSPAGSPHSTAYYPLLVHRHGILPRPSFGPHLAVGTLVSANGSCGQARKGLSPSRFAPCWAHGKSQLLRAAATEAHELGEVYLEMAFMARIIEVSVPAYLV